MTFQPGQSGNPEGARRKKLMREAIHMAVSVDDYRALREMAEKQRDLAIAGDLGAFKEIADRLDGKVPQAQIHIGDEDGGPVRVEKIERIVVRPDPADTNGGSVPAVSEPG